MLTTVQANGIEVPVAVTGVPEAPAMLLVAGTSQSMDAWRPDLTGLLVGAGLRVVRYDQRDTGMAPADPPGAPRYGLRDLVKDAVGVLDALGIEAAHWVGFSQGGWVAQLAAIHAPARVASLTLIATRPVGHGPNDPDLPEPADRVLAAFADGAAPPPADDRAAWTAFLVEGERPFASVRAPFDESDVQELATAMVARTRDPLAMLVNHPMAPQGPPWRGDLGRIRVPTTVVHGDDDPMFPLENGRALAREIPGARLRVLPDVGHELPRRARPAVAGAIIETVTRARPAIDLIARDVLGVEHLATVPGAEARTSAIAGRGLFATAAFARGAVLCHLDGQELDVHEHPAALEALEWNALSPDRLLVRAVRTSYGLMNHSADPNVEVDGTGRRLLARRDVTAGDELTLDYLAQPVPEAYLRGAEVARIRGGGRLPAARPPRVSAAAAG